MQSQLCPTLSHNSKSNYTANRECPNEVDSDKFAKADRTRYGGSFSLSDDIRNLFQDTLNPSLLFGIPCARRFWAGSFKAILFKSTNKILSHEMIRC